MDTLRIRGTRTHNLRNLDLDLPRDRLIVITGLSGSGYSLSELEPRLFSFNNPGGACPTGDGL
jgi:excinuclease UvrABC ATPase subunit